MEARAQAYVVAVSGKEYGGRGWQPPPVQTVWATLPPDGGTRLSAGAGTKGLRWDEWRWLPLAPPRLPAWRRWLLVRRSGRAPTHLPAYVVLAPHESSLEAVGRGAGSRWTVESCFEEATGEVGLDHYAVRRWTGWYRPITLAMGAYALLTVWRAAHRSPEEPNNTRRPSHPSRLATFKATRGLACR